MSFLVGTPPSARRDAFRGRDQPSLRDMSPEQLREEVKRLRKDLVEFEDRYQKSGRDNKKLIRELAVYAKCHDADKAKIAELLPYKVEYNTVQDTIKDLEKARADEHIKYLQALVLQQQTEAKLKQAQQHITELPSLRSQSADTTASLKDTESKLTDANSSLQQAQDALTATEQKLAESQQQFQDLQQQLDVEKQQHEKEMTAAKAELQATANELQAAAMAADAAKQQVQQLQEQTHRDAAKVAEMQQLIDTLRQDLHTHEVELAESENRRKGLQQQLDEAQHAKFAQEVEFQQQQRELLGDVHQLQALLAALSNQLQAAVQQERPEASVTTPPKVQLAEAAAERIAALEQDLAAAERQIEELSADLAAARDAARIAAASVSEHESMLASLQQELSHAQRQVMSAQKGSMTAVLRAADDHRRAGLSRLADQEQQETQTALQEVTEELQAQVASLQQELTSARESLWEAVKRADDVDSQAGEQASRIVHMQSQLAVQQAAVQAKQQLLEEAIEGQKKLQYELKQAQKHVDSLTENQDQLLETLEKLQHQVNVGKNQVMEAQQLAARSTAEISLARREVGAALRDVALVRTEIGSMRSTLTTLSAELTAEESGLSAIELEADRLRIQLKNAAADTALGDAKEVERSMFEYYSGRADDIMKQLQSAKSQQIANRGMATSAAERLERLLAYLVAVSQRLANLTSEVSTADNSRASSMPGVLAEEALNPRTLQQQLLQHQLLQRLHGDDEVQSAAAAATSSSSAAAAGLVHPLSLLHPARPASSASGSSHQPDSAAAAAAGDSELPATPASTPAHSMMGSSGTPYQTPWPATALAATAAAAGLVRSPLDHTAADVAPFPAAAIEAAAEQGEVVATPVAAEAHASAQAAVGAPEPSWRLHPAYGPARSASAPSTTGVSKQQQQQQPVVSPADIDQLLALVNRAGDQYETREDFKVAIEAVTGAFAAQDQQQLLQQAQLDDSVAETEAAAAEAEQMKQQQYGKLHEPAAQESISLQRGIPQEQQQQQSECGGVVATDQDLHSSVVSVAGGGGSTVDDFIQEEHCEDEADDNVIVRRYLEGASTIGSTAGSVHSVRSSASGSSSSAALAAPASADAQQPQQQLMQQHAMATITAAPRVGGVQLDAGDSSGVSNQVPAGTGVNPSLDDSASTPHFWRHPAVVGSASQRSPGSVSSTSGPAHHITPSRPSHLSSQSEPATPESVLRAVDQNMAADQADQAAAGDVEALNLGSFSSPLMFQMSPVGMTPQHQQLPAATAAAVGGSDGSSGSISLGSPPPRAVSASPGSSSLGDISFRAGSPSLADSPCRTGANAGSSSSNPAAGARPPVVPKLKLNLVQSSMSNGSHAGGARASGSFSGFHGGSSVGDVIPIPQIPTGESDADEGTSAEVQQQRWPLHESDCGGDGVLRGSFAGFAGDASVGDVIPIPPVPSDGEVTTSVAADSSIRSGSIAQAGTQQRQHQADAPGAAFPSGAEADVVNASILAPDSSSSVDVFTTAAAAATPEVPKMSALPVQQQQQQVVLGPGATPGPDAYYTAQSKAPWMTDAEGATASVSPVAFGGYAVEDTAAAAATPAAVEDANDKVDQENKMQSLRQQVEGLGECSGSTPEMQQQQQQRQQEFFTCAPDVRTRTAAAAVAGQAADPLQQVTTSSEVQLRGPIANEHPDIGDAVVVGSGSSDDHQQQQQESDAVADQLIASDAASEVGSSSGAAVGGLNAPGVTGDGDEADGSVSGESPGEQEQHELGDDGTAVADDTSGIGGHGSNTGEPETSAAATGPPEPEGPSAIKQLVKRLEFDDEDLASSEYD